MKQIEITELANQIDATIIETHVSWVLLTNKYAYKIKKPVNMGFLDFSTLEERKHFCEEELKLNREYSEDIYKDIVEIKKNEYVSIQGEGEVIDYAVQMKALDNDKRLDKLLKNNKVSKKEIRKLAHIIAAFHQKAKSYELDKLKTLSYEFEDLLKVMHVSGHVPDKKVNRMNKVSEKVSKFLEVHKPYFIERKNNGMIKEIHGDLHSRNIFLYSTPILFDRIEFSKNFRTIDLLNEIAFLCVDLDYFVQKKLSKEFLLTYLKDSNIPFGDEEYKIFIFYKAFVANIRAKVNLLLAEQENSSKRKKHYKRFKKYFKLMNKYVRQLKKPSIIP